MAFRNRLLEAIRARFITTDVSPNQRIEIGSEDPTSTFKNWIRFFTGNSAEVLPARMLVAMGLGTSSTFTISAGEFGVDVEDPNWESTTISLTGNAIAGYPTRIYLKADETDLIANNVIRAYTLIQRMDGGPIAKWQTVPDASMSNGHINVVADPVGYYLDAAGMVHMRGETQNATALGLIFVLPVGYRPSSDMLGYRVHKGAIGVSNGARIDVLANGRVEMTANDAGLSAAQFFTEIQFPIW